MKSFTLFICAAIVASSAAVNEPVASPAAVERELAEYERQLGTGITGTPTKNPPRPSGGSYYYSYGYDSGKSGKGKSGKGKSGKSSSSKGSKGKSGKSDSYGSYGYSYHIYGSGKSGKSKGSKSKSSKSSSKGSKSGGYYY